jgi:hypothetical protein
MVTMANRRRLRAVDTEEFNRALEAGDDLTMIVMGHVHLEALLNVSLARVVPEGLDLVESLPFNSRVDLAIAFGRLGMDVRDAWRMVYALRNRFAHDFRATLSDDDAKALRAAIPRTLWRYFPVEPELEPDVDSSAWVTAAVRWGLTVLYADALRRTWSGGPVTHRPASARPG